MWKRNEIKALRQQSLFLLVLLSVLLYSIYNKTGGGFVFRCKNNILAICVICIGIGIMLSALLTKFALLCGIIVLAVGIVMGIKG